LVGGKENEAIKAAQEALRYIAAHWFPRNRGVPNVHCLEAVKLLEKMKVRR
jgi:hypothetical protein